MKNYSNEIPFGKAVRLGNYKLWRGNFTIGSGSERSDIACVYISNLDGSWMTRIPSTSAMYGVIVGSYSTADKDLRDKFLGMILTNIYNISLNPSEALHDAFFLLSEIMTYPYLLLDEKQMKSHMTEDMKAAGIDSKKVKEHVSKMVEYRRDLYRIINEKRDKLLKDYKEQMQERVFKEKEAEKAMEQDEIAEEAMEVLQK